MSELNEELNKIVSDLHNAKIDVHEGKRQKTRAENLESLKRLYPGHVVTRWTHCYILMCSVDLRISPCESPVVFIMFPT